MCNKCANLANRLPYERIKAIRATDLYRGSKEHQEDMKRLALISEQLKKEKK